MQQQIAPETISLTRAPLLGPVELFREPAQLQAARQVDLVAHFSGAFDLADGQPIGHAARVAHLTLAFARELNLDGASRRRVLYAALLHDSGVSICDLPPGLDGAGGHTAAGVWLASLIGLDEETQHVIRCTHEHWDGNGRPAQLMMSDILVEALTIIAAHWATDLLGPVDNLFRARVTLRGFPLDEIEPLVGLRVGRAAMEQLQRDDVWMALWDDQLPARVAEQAPGEGRASIQHVEHVAAAMGAVVDSAVRESGRCQLVADLAAELGRQLELDATHGRALRVVGHGYRAVGRPTTHHREGLDPLDRGDRIDAATPELGGATAGDVAGIRGGRAWVESHHERPDGRGYPDLLTQSRSRCPRAS